MAAAAAISDLNGRDVGGRRMRVERSTGGADREDKRSKTTKLFVGNVAMGTSQEELRALFEPHCAVIEADVIDGKNFGFVHVDVGPNPTSPGGKQKLQEILERLDGADVRGNRVRVQSSTSAVRKSAGMGGETSCYRCGGVGHWSKECGGGHGQRPAGARGGRGRDRGGMRGGRGRPRDPPYPQRGGCSQNYNGYYDYGGYEEDYSRDQYEFEDFGSFGPRGGGGPMRRSEGYYGASHEAQGQNYRGYNNNLDGFNAYYTRRPPPLKPPGRAVDLREPPPSRGYSIAPPSSTSPNYSYYSSSGSAEADYG